MTLRSTRTQHVLSDETLQPVDLHGLDSADKTRSHAEEFHNVKKDIEQGRACRRNSIGRDPRSIRAIRAAGPDRRLERNSKGKDPRSIAAIRAAGPDGRFDDIVIEDSGIRDGLFARSSMPAFPFVQDFDRPTRELVERTVSIARPEFAEWKKETYAKWKKEELDEAREQEESAKVQEDSELSNSVEVSSEDFSPSPKSGRRSVVSKGRKAAKTKARFPQKAASAAKSSKNLTGAKTTVAGVTYACYAKNCKYTHARRGNFSIHWKRDAKHKGEFELGKILQSSQDSKTGEIITIPYGEVKTCRPRHSFGRSTSLTDDSSEEDIEDKSSPVKVEETERPIMKRKATTGNESSYEEVPRRMRTRSSAVAAPDTKTSAQRPGSPASAVLAPEIKTPLQGSGPPNSTVTVPAPEIKTPLPGSNPSASDISTSATSSSPQSLTNLPSTIHTNTLRAALPLAYTPLELTIFRRPADVPLTFPSTLAPLVSHGETKSQTSNAKGGDFRFFCPQCLKCFTQAHNVASHFLKTHGKKYSDNDRARTVRCRATLSKSRVNCDARPLDATVVPRLLQLNKERAREKMVEVGKEALASKEHKHSRQPSWEEVKQKQKRTLALYLKDYEDEDDDEDAGCAEIEGTPAKRKMTLKEYTALGRGAK